MVSTVVSTPMSNRNQGVKIIDADPRVDHDFEVIETYEAGIVLHGNAPKSLRKSGSGAELRGSFATIDNGSVTLHGLAITAGVAKGGYDHRLLLRRAEIDRIERKLRVGNRLTLVPRRMYWNADGRVKIELCLARGLRDYDKRVVQRERDAQREVDRALST